MTGGATSPRGLVDALEDMLDEQDRADLEELEGMTPEAIDAEARSYGYDPSRRVGAYAAARAKAYREPLPASDGDEGAPPKRTLADALDDMLDEADEEDMAELARMSPEELDAEARSYGYDPAGREKASVVARDAGSGVPVQTKAASTDAAPSASAAPSKPAKVVSLAAARERRVATTRWVPMLAAAAIVVLFASGASMTVADLGKPKVEYTTYVPPPTPAERAAPVVWWSLRQCEMGNYGRCADGLDAAEAIDPAVESDPRVVEARQLIAEDIPWGAPGLLPELRLEAKPGLRYWVPPMKKTP